MSREFLVKALRQESGNAALSGNRLHAMLLKLAADEIDALDAALWDR